MPDVETPDTGVVPDAPVESITDVNAARQAWLAAPPPEGDAADAIAAQRAAQAAAAAAQPTDAAIEAQAIEEQLGTPPAGQEGTPPAEGAQPTPAPAPPGVPPGADPFGLFGGYEAVRNAMAVQESLRTEQGVRQMAANALVTLGYDPQQVRELLTGQAPPVEEQWQAQPDLLGDVPDEEPVELTAGDVRALLDAAAQRAAQAAIQQTEQKVAPLQQQIAESNQRAMFQLTDNAVIAVLGAPPEDAAQRQAYADRVDQVVGRAQQYYDPNRWSDPAMVSAAITRANAELTAADDARYNAYLESKRQTMLAQPPNTAGSAAGSEPIPEPKNLAEATKLARESGFFD